MHLFIANLQIHELTHFSILDWIIVAIYLSISLVIGIYVTRYTTNMDAYIGAGRSVGPWLGVATMTGTEMGLITVMYMAQSGFTGGFAAFHMALIAGGATLFVGLTGFIVKPLRAHRVLTIPEYYEKRFGRKVRIVGGIILSAAGILNMGLFLQVGAKFIVAATGLPIDGNALIVVMTVLLILVLVYTVLGGMISVIITDYTQFVVLSFGIIVTTVLAIYTLGLNSMYEAVKTGMGRKGFDPTDPSGPFGTAYVTYQIIAAGLIGCAVWPTAVSRHGITRSSQKAIRAFKRLFYDSFFDSHVLGYRCLHFRHTTSSRTNFSIPRRQCNRRCGAICHARISRTTTANRNFGADHSRHDCRFYVDP